MSPKKPFELEGALLDPSAYFDAPREVLADERLTPAQKEEVLRRWEYDAREMAVAEEENMGGGEPDRLAEVAHALAALAGGEVPRRSGANKQGGE